MSHSRVQIHGKLHHHNNGYGTLQIVNTTLGNANYSLYLQSTTQGVLLRTDPGAVSIGDFYTQSQSSFAASEVNGPYAFSVAGLSSNGAIDKLGQFRASASGSATGTEDVNDSGTLSPKLAATATYTLASDGRGSLNITAGGGTRVLNFYLISPGQMLLIGMDGDQASSGGADQQFPISVARGRRLVVSWLHAPVAQLDRAADFEPKIDPSNCWPD